MRLNYKLFFQINLFNVLIIFNAQCLNYNDKFEEEASYEQAIENIKSWHEKNSLIFIGYETEKFIEEDIRLINSKNIIDILKVWINTRQIYYLGQYEENNATSKFDKNNAIRANAVLMRKLLKDISIQEIEETDISHLSGFHMFNPHEGKKITLSNIILNNYSDIKTIIINMITPIDFMIKLGFEETLNMFLERGISPNSKISGKSILHIAIEYGNDNISLLLLQKGADANNRDQNGQTPLHIAVKSNNIKAVKFLIKRFGANSNLKDNNGDTPLYLAGRLNNYALLKMLAPLENSKLTAEIIDEEF